MALSAFCDSQKIVVGIPLVFSVFFAAISRAFKIAHSSVSRISLFFLRKIPFSVHRLSLFSFQHTAAPTGPFSSFDPSVHITRPARSFFASSTAFSFASIITSPLNPIPDFIISTGFTPSAGSIECPIVICQANHCPYEVGRVFSVHMKVFFGNSPG